MDGLEDNHAHDQSLGYNLNISTAFILSERHIQFNLSTLSGNKWVAFGLRDNQVQSILSGDCSNKWMALGL